MEHPIKMDDLGVPYLNLWKASYVHNFPLQSSDIFRVTNFWMIPAPIPTRSTVYFKQVFHLEIRMLGVDFPHPRWTPWLNVPWKKEASISAAKEGEVCKIYGRSFPWRRENGRAVMTTDRLGHS